MTGRELAIILAAGAAVYATRLSLLALAGRTRLPGWVWAWLRYVPVAVFTALIVPAVLRPEGRLDLSPRNPYLIAAAVAALVAWRTKHVLATLLAGVAAILVARALI